MKLTFIGDGKIRAWAFRHAFTILNVSNGICGVGRTVTIKTMNKNVLSSRRARDQSEKPNDPWMPMCADIFVITDNVLHIIFVYVQLFMYNVHVQLYIVKLVNTCKHL